MKCSRINCNRVPSPWGRGMCEYHADVWRKENGFYLIDSTPAKLHLRQIRATGMKYTTLSERTGIPTSTLHNVKSKSRIMAHISARLLAYPVPWARQNSLAKNLTPAFATQRRLQALSAMGYTNEELCRQISYPVSRFPKLIAGSAEFVTRRVHNATKEAFDSLHMVIPTGEKTGILRAKSRARKRGWALPLQWDEEDIDNPLAVPHEMVNQKVGDWTSELKVYQAMGLSIKEMAKWEGVSVEAMTKRLGRMNAA